VSSGKWRPPVLSQPYPGTADLCPGGPVPSPQLVEKNMENLISNNKKDNSSKKEPDTLKKSKVVTNDDKTSTPAKASEQRSRLSPTHHNDNPKPPTSYSNLRGSPTPVSWWLPGQRSSRIPPNQAGPLERKKAFRILKRLATNPIREDQTSKLDYPKIQEDIAWAKAVIPDFDIAVTTSNSIKRERSMETAQPASKKARTTIGRSLESSTRAMKAEGSQGTNGVWLDGPLHQWPWKCWTKTQVRHPIAQIRGGTRAMLNWSPVRTRDREHFTRLPLTRSARFTPGPIWQFARPLTSRLDRERGYGCRRNPRNQGLFSDQVQPEAYDWRLEGGQGGENRARHYERGNPLEPGLLGTQRSSKKTGWTTSSIRCHYASTTRINLRRITWLPLRRTNPRATSNWSMGWPPSLATCQPTRSWQKAWSSCAPRTWPDQGALFSRT